MTDWDHNVVGISFDGIPDSSEALDDDNENAAAYEELVAFPLTGDYTATQDDVMQTSIQNILPPGGGSSLANRQHGITSKGTTGTRPEYVAAWIEKASDDIARGWYVFKIEDTPGTAFNNRTSYTTVMDSQHANANRGFPSEIAMGVSLVWLSTYTQGDSASWRDFDLFTKVQQLKWTFTAMSGSTSNGTVSVTLSTEEVIDESNTSQLRFGTSGARPRLWNGDQSQAAGANGSNQFGSGALSQSWWHDNYVVFGRTQQNILSANYTTWASCGRGSAQTGYLNSARQLGGWNNTGQGVVDWQVGNLAHFEVWKWGTFVPPSTSKRPPAMNPAAWLKWPWLGRKNKSGTKYKAMRRGRRP